MLLGKTGNEKDGGAAEGVDEGNEKEGSLTVDEVAETDVSGGGGDLSSSAEQLPVLVPLADGDGFPLQWVEKGVTGLNGTVLYRATTSSTYYVEEVSELFL